jgi:hypothetical protein
MSGNQNRLDGPMQDLVADPVLKQALGHFRRSMHAWSEAAYSAPRTQAQIAVRRSWRMAVAWALGLVVAAGSLSGGLYERHHQQVLAKLKAEQEAKQRQLAVQQRTRQEDEDLLATVDSDISREVPAAMEPLAQLMDSNTGQ